MNLSEYILLPREERIKHTATCTENWCVVGSSISGRPKQLRETLLTNLGVTDDVQDWNLAGIQVCHVCPQDSTNYYCAEPTHAYMGTAKENAADRIQDPKEKEVWLDPLWKYHLRLTEPCSFDETPITKESHASFLGFLDGELTPLCNNRHCTNKNHWTFVPKGQRRKALREAAAERIKHLYGLNPDASAKALATQTNTTEGLVRRILKENSLKPPCGADGTRYPPSHRVARLTKLQSALLACTKYLGNHQETLTQMLNIVEKELTDDFG